jgi:membrane-associated HD superfamily phosphohydrolase
VNNNQYQPPKDKDNSLDKDLADFSTQYQRQKLPKNKAINYNKDKNLSNQVSNNNKLIDSFITNLLNKHRDINKAQINKSNIEIDLENFTQKFPQKIKTKDISEQSEATDKSLNNITQEFQKKQTETTETIEKIRQQELEKQRQKKQLVRQAQVWLENLDPYSDEGFWFEQFSHSYPSKLEAAIEYLKALQ